MQMRLDRFLSDMGAATRSEAKRLVRQGRVRVAGSPAASPDMKIDPVRDAVELDGAAVAFRSRALLMMDKPAGYVCASSDRRERTVMELLGEPWSRRDMFTVGRLDKDTTGLLIITDDGELAHRLISPSHCVWKRYRASVEGTPTQDDAAAFEKGIILADGTKCLPARMEICADSMLVWVREGKYHQVKRMLAARGMHVTALRREAVGELELDPSLGAGGYRELTEEEAERLSGGLMQNG